MTVLAEHLTDYLALRVALGHKLAEAHRLLPRFVTYMEERDIEFVTIETALASSLDRDVPASSTVPARQMMLVRGFARYLSGIDPRTQVPPAGTIRARAIAGASRSSTATRTSSRLSKRPGLLAIRCGRRPIRR